MQIVDMFEYDFVYGLLKANDKDGRFAAQRGIEIVYDVLQLYQTPDDYVKHLWYSADNFIVPMMESHAFQVRKGALRCPELQVLLTVVNKDLCMLQDMPVEAAQMSLKAYMKDYLGEPAGRKKMHRQAIGKDMKVCFVFDCSPTNTYTGRSHFLLPRIR